MYYFRNVSPFNSGPNLNPSSSPEASATTGSVPGTSIQLPLQDGGHIQLAIPTLRDNDNPLIDNILNTPVTEPVTELDHDAKDSQERQYRVFRYDAWSNPRLSRLMDPDVQVTLSMDPARQNTLVRCRILDLSKASAASTTIPVTANFSQPPHSRQIQPTNERRRFSSVFTRLRSLTTSSSSPSSSAPSVELASAPSPVQSTASRVLDVKYINDDTKGMMEITGEIDHETGEFAGTVTGKLEGNHLIPVNDGERISVDASLVSGNPLAASAKKDKASGAAQKETQSADTNKEKRNLSDVSESYAREAMSSNKKLESVEERQIETSLPVTPDNRSIASQDEEGDKEVVSDPHTASQSTDYIFVVHTPSSMAQTWNAKHRDESTSTDTVAAQGTVLPSGAKYEEFDIGSLQKRIAKLSEDTNQAAATTVLNEIVQDPASLGSTAGTLTRKGYSRLAGNLRVLEKLEAKAKSSQQTSVQWLRQTLDPILAPLPEQFRATPDPETSGRCIEALGQVTNIHDATHAKAAIKVLIGVDFSFHNAHPETATAPGNPIPTDTAFWGLHGRFNDLKLSANRDAFTAFYNNRNQIHEAADQDNGKKPALALFRAMQLLEVLESHETPKAAGPWLNALLVRVLGANAEKRPDLTNLTKEKRDAIIDALKRDPDVKKALSNNANYHISKLYPFIQSVTGAKLRGK